LDPFLGRRAKLSRSYANQTVLSLLLVLCTLMILATTVSRQGDTAKHMLAESCTGLEIATNTLALTPQYTALAINRHTTAAVRSALDNAAALVSLTLTLVKQLLLYILFRYHRVMLCALEMTVLSAAGAVSSHAQQITDFVNTQFQEVSRALADGLDGINAQLRTVNDAIDKLPRAPSVPIFGGGGGGVSVPRVGPVAIPGASDRLRNVALPSAFLQSLRGLNSSIPTLNDIESRVSDLISKPLADLSARVASRLSSTTIGDLDVLPVPIVKPVRFCADGAYDVAWIDRVVEATTVSLWYGCLGLVIAMMVVTVAYMAYIAWEHGQQERSMSQLRALLDHDMGSSRSMQSHDTAMASDLKDIAVRRLVAAIEHPLLFTVHDVIARRLFGSSSTSLASLLTSPHAIRIQWFLLYISHPLSLWCILLGIVGLLAVRFQLLILGLIVTRLVPFLAGDVTRAMNLILGRVSDAMDDSIGPYVTQVNARMASVEAATNAVLTGWLTDTITTVDTGIDAIFGGFAGAVGSVFASVPVVQAAVTDFSQCVVGNQTRALLNAVKAAINNGSVVSLPRVVAADLGIDAGKLVTAFETTTRMMNLTDGSGSASSKAASSPVANGTLSLFREQILWMQHEYEQTLWLQMIPFAAVLVFGLLVVLLGLIAVLWDVAA
ncbi:hypothetical protein BC831DRAFT_387962, partial [Entophlyctis helioformis]